MAFGVQEPEVQPGHGRRSCPIAVARAADPRPLKPPWVNVALLAVAPNEINQFAKLVAFKFARKVSWRNHYRKRCAAVTFEECGLVTHDLVKL